MQQSATSPTDSAMILAREQIWAALLLAWVAAFSDAIGFLVLQQLGASFMSGNSMALGVALGRLEWALMLQRGLPILTFFLGNLLGFLVLTQARRWGIRSPFAIVFGLEAACLLAFLLLGPPALEGGTIPPSRWGIFSGCVMLLTLAMGLQTATVRRAAGQRVRTTFVTGILSDWAQALTQYLSWLQQQPPEQPLGHILRQSVQLASFQHLFLLAGIWGCYVLGAICGSALELYMTLWALAFPTFVLTALLVLDVVHPLQPPDMSLSHA